MSGFLLHYPWIGFPALLIAFLILGYTAAPYWAFAVLGMIKVIGLGFGWIPCTILGAILALLGFPATRQAIFTGPVLKLLVKMKFLPEISQTEREALEAGTVWADAELFSGKPNWERLVGEAYPGLNEAEQAFLDGPAETVCRMTNDWQVWKERDLPAEVWEYLKREKFFGMIIPKEYGGLGLSGSANSAVVAKLSSHSSPLGITVMVPNSLGPAELLLHYGTDAQKDYYLPRLADGREIPCFALTEPAAGSDAGAIQANGEVFLGDDGSLLIRLNWNKRYITLAAVSTLLGLAFKLRDPNNLLGKGTDLGVTCALVPTNLQGVVLGRRHDPMGVPFFNCPTQGHDVVVSIDAIIGGREKAGRGWLMLMESLAAGRGISLPASSTAGAHMAARVAGAYAAIRKQFGMPIGKFEGIVEPLARIAGRAYLLEAARRYTLGAIDSGAKPAVVTAMAKYNFTEQSRQSINDAMDIVGGAGISLGPRNLLAHAYMSLPIGITVEGANILTRTLVIFGQGAIRCHPYAYKEMGAIAARDVPAFDKAFTGHIGHVVRNTCRSIVLSLSRGNFAVSPVSGPAARYYRKLSWASASFATMADVAMGVYGGNLKRREALTGRFADVFSWMYLGNAVLKRFEAEGRRPEDLPFLRWSMDYTLFHIQQGFDGIFRNFDAPLVGWFFRGPIALWSRFQSIGSYPRDKDGAELAVVLQTPGALRDRITSTIFRGEVEGNALHELEHAFRLCHEADEVIHKLKAAIRAGKLPREKPMAVAQQAKEQGILTAAEFQLLHDAEVARDDRIQVDSYTLEEYKASAVTTEVPAHPGEIYTY
ncbi:MAG: acyl-CoA dehydrogenase [Planctomycetes bacterium]|nr:acyl-CoA dehydrogenase [Planctomycetota bacterium]MCB9910304.1 acyl-CoA dehydrogenase [Planctomycetota bacterium]HPF13090.1 acyl-CoA dehydrogenase [Planctomycetota bacterium]HRV80128.1 acyl-CoA dehydrogenase [Planctomycetota bacterium]